MAEHFERRADGPSGVDHVVHQHYSAVVDRHRNVHMRRLLCSRPVDIVAVWTDIDDTDRGRRAGERFHLAPDATGEMRAARANADERDATGAASLDDLMGHAADGA